MKIHSLYWVHKESHTDITNEGYIGVTSTTPLKRWNKHKRHFKVSGSKGCQKLKRAYLKYGDDLKVTLLVLGSKDYIYDLEGKLRPTPEIGVEYR